MSDFPHGSDPGGSIPPTGRTESIEVAAGLVFREGRLLIAQRLRTDHLGGLWEFPGGKREADETFESCLVRELWEELGIEIIVGELVEELSHRYPEKTVHLKFFRCAWKRHEPRAIGCADLKWVNPGELGGFAFPAADARLISRLKDEARLWG